MLVGCGSKEAWLVIACLVIAVGAVEQRATLRAELEALDAALLRIEQHRASALRVDQLVGDDKNETAQHWVFNKCRCKIQDAMDDPKHRGVSFEGCKKPQKPDEYYDIQLDESYSLKLGMFPPSLVPFPQKNFVLTPLVPMSTGPLQKFINRQVLTSDLEAQKAKEKGKGVKRIAWLLVNWVNRQLRDLGIIVKTAIRGIVCMLHNQWRKLKAMFAKAWKLIKKGWDKFKKYFTEVKAKIGKAYNSAKKTAKAHWEHFKKSKTRHSCRARSKVSKCSKVRSEAACVKSCYKAWINSYYCEWVKGKCISSDAVGGSKKACESKGQCARGNKKKGFFLESGSVAEYYTPEEMEFAEHLHAHMGHLSDEEFHRRVGMLETEFLSLRTHVKLLRQTVKATAPQVEKRGFQGCLNSKNALQGLLQMAIVVQAPKFFLGLFYLSHLNIGAAVLKLMPEVVYDVLPIQVESHYMKKCAGGNCELIAKEVDKETNDPSKSQMDAQIAEAKLMKDATKGMAKEAPEASKAVSEAEAAAKKGSSLLETKALTAEHLTTFSAEEMENVAAIERLLAEMKKVSQLKATAKKITQILDICTCKFDYQGITPHQQEKHREACAKRNATTMVSIQRVFAVEWYLFPLPVINAPNAMVCWVISPAEGILHPKGPDKVIDRLRITRPGRKAEKLFSSNVKKAVAKAQKSNIGKLLKTLEVRLYSMFQSAKVIMKTIVHSLLCVLKVAWLKFVWLAKAAIRRYNKIKAAVGSKLVDAWKSTKSWFKSKFSKKDKDGKPKASSFLQEQVLSTAQVLVQLNAFQRIQAMHQLSEEMLSTRTFVAALTHVVRGTLHSMHMERVRTGDHASGALGGCISDKTRTALSISFNVEFPNIQFALAALLSGDWVTVAKKILPSLWLVFIPVKVVVRDSSGVIVKDKNGKPKLEFPKGCSGKAASKSFKSAEASIGQAASSSATSLEAGEEPKPPVMTVGNSDKPAPATDAKGQKGSEAEKKKKEKGKEDGGAKDKKESVTAQVKANLKKPAQSKKKPKQQTKKPAQNKKKPKQQKKKPKQQKKKPKQSKRKPKQQKRKPQKRKPKQQKKKPKQSKRLKPKQQKRKPKQQKRKPQKRKPKQQKRKPKQSKRKPRQRKRKPHQQKRKPHQQKRKPHQQKRKRKQSKRRPKQQKSKRKASKPALRQTKQQKRAPQHKKKSTRNKSVEEQVREDLGYV